MFGAIIGDIIGSPYEGRNSKPFDARKIPLFIDKSRFTDDTVMTIAVCEGIMRGNIESSDDELRENLITAMRYWGRKYPHAGYGRSFKQWLTSNKPQPYGSFANGSAMRVSSVGWLYESLERTSEVAQITAEVTHNHPDAIKGTQAVAGAIFLARNGAAKNEIKKFITENFKYDLNQRLTDIRPTHTFDITCVGTVRDAFISFFDSEDFESAIRNAISLGGDTDTIAAIAGSIAEAFYGIPDSLMREAAKRIPSKMTAVLLRFFINRFDELTEPEQENINNNLLSKINPNNIWACSVSAAGAMGAPGSVDILYTDESKVRYFYADWVSGDLNIKKFEKFFKPLGIFGKTGEAPEGWNFYYLGCGNFLLMKSELYNSIKPYIDKIPEYEMYSIWLRLSCKILKKSFILK